MLADVPKELDDLPVLNPIIIIQQQRTVLTVKIDEL